MQSVSVKKVWAVIPPTMRRFLLRAGLLFAGWLLLYHLVLEPAQIPDRWLTNITGDMVAKLSDLVYGNAYLKAATAVESAYVNVHGRDVLMIGNGCNAFDLMVLFVGFILCVPTSIKRAVLFSVAGILSVFILNILRCTALVWVAVNQHHLFDFAHKYLFTAVVYCFIFSVWVWYAKKYKPAA